MKRLLVEQIRQDHDLFGEATSQAERPVDMVFGSLRTAIERHGRIAIPGFGVFVLKHVPERQVRNPRTGERTIQPAHDVVKFKEAKRK